MILFSVSFLLAFPRQGKKSPKDLPEKYRLWLEQEVVYIITPKEKEVYLRLESDRERNLFIKAFWKQRDPTPGSLENEFKEEHYQRINYANNWFGRESVKAGWRTDRGRIYIILGPPQDIERYEGRKQLYPTQIWAYAGDPALGLPPQFNLVFYQRNGVGDHVLYSPIKDGPGSLIAGFMGNAYDITATYNQLKYIEPNVARISLSLIPGSREQFDPSFRSFASDVLVSAKIPSFPYKKIETAYAEKLLKYKDIIEVEYTANYIDNDSLVRVIRDRSGIFFVHYAVEPKKLSIEQYENKFYTTLEANGMVTDLNGKTIFQYRKSLPIEFNKDQLDKIKTKLFSLQDMFPLIEGNYKFNLLLKNTVSKEFTSIEKDITITKGSSLQMSSLILAYKVDKNSIYEEKNKPFLIGKTQLVPSPRNDFSLKDSLYLFFQIHGLDEELKENGILEYSIYKEEKKVHSITKKINEYQDAPNIFEEISLINFSPAAYKIKVSLLDKNKSEVLFEQDYFFISFSASLPRPWILSQVSFSSTNPIYSNILGNQFLNKQEIIKAIPLLENAYRKNLDSLKFSYDYARALFHSKKYKKIKEILKPFIKTQVKKYEFLALLGIACQKLEDLEEAISYYKEYLVHHGTNLNILNSIGECYYKLGKTQEALVAWEKSLKINPKQKAIKKIVDSIRKE